MKSFTFRFWRGTFLAVMMTTWVVPAVTAQRALADPAENREVKSDATEQTASPQEKLIGKWGVTSDEDNRFVFTFAADGTFEILATDPETPHKVKAEVSGTYKVDFSVSPAHLDLDTTIRKRKDEKPVKHKFEMIVQIIDSNKIRISDMGLAQRPKEFGKQSPILQRQTPPAPDADAQSPMLEESQGNIKASEGRVSISLAAENTSEIFPVELKISITNRSDKAIPLASLMRSSVLKFDGKDYSLHKLFHDRWDKMAAIPPGKNVVVKSYSTWYGIQDFGTIGANLHGKIDWQGKLTVGDHTIALRLGDATSNSVRVKILADT